MKYATLATIGLGLVVTATTAQAQAPTPAGGAELKTMDQKVAYALGLNIGRSMKQQGLELDPSVVSQGLIDGLADKSIMTEPQIKEVMQAFSQQMQAKQQEMLAKRQNAAASSPEAEKNLKAGQAFLAENKTKPGVTTLPSGVQYKVLKQGTGATPTANDAVLANYRGTLIDGTEFDSSYKRGEPAEFPVSGVIKGWTEVLQKMKVGDKFQVFIPADMAYGPAQRGQLIGPNLALVFEIELLDVKKGGGE